MHRNNVIVTERTGRLVDWEVAQYGMPMLDLITLGGPGSRGHERYSAAWRALTGEDTASPAWRRGYLAATVGVKVKYLTFAARNFGDSHATRMLEDATRALAELERAAGP